MSRGRVWLTTGRANVMQYTLKYLALHPNVQDELYSEIQAICGDRQPEFNDLSKFVYGLCVMYETMRLHPIAGAFAMTVASSHDETLLGRYPIPKEAVLGIDLWAVHRNEKYWGDNADEFDPSRFGARNRTDNDSSYSTDGKTKMPVRGTFIGFSEGPRACLGNIRNRMC